MLLGAIIITARVRETCILGYAAVRLYRGPVPVSASRVIILIVEDITNLLGKRKKTDNPLEKSEKRPKVVAFTLGQLEEAGKQQYPNLGFMSCMNECGDSAFFASF